MSLFSHYVTIMSIKMVTLYFDHTFTMMSNVFTFYFMSFEGDWRHFSHYVMVWSQLRNSILYLFLGKNLQIVFSRAGKKLQYHLPQRTNMITEPTHMTHQKKPVYLPGVTVFCGSVKVTNQERIFWIVEYVFSMIDMKSRLLIIDQWWR